MHFVGSCYIFLPKRYEKYATSCILVYFRPVFLTYTLIRPTLSPFNMEITKSHAGHVKRMGQNRNAYIILVEKPRRKVTIWKKQK